MPSAQISSVSVWQQHEIARKKRPMINGIRAVFFDAGNTLVYLDYERIAREFRRYGVECDAEDCECVEYFARRAFDAAMAEDTLTGKDPWDLYFGVFASLLGVDDDSVISTIIETLWSENAGAGLWHVIPHSVTATLETLKAMGLCTGVISNSDGKLIERFQRDGFDGYFDFIIDSQAVGYEKPAREIFHIALSAAGVKPQEAIHVGDLHYADVVGAQNAGITPVMLDPAQFGWSHVRSISDISELPSMLINQQLTMPIETCKSQRD